MISSNSNRRAAWQLLFTPIPLVLLFFSLLPSILIVVFMECARSNVIEKTSPWGGRVIVSGAVGMIVAPIVVGLLVPRITSMQPRTVPRLILSLGSFCLNLTILALYIGMGRMN